MLLESRVGTLPSEMPDAVMRVFSVKLVNEIPFSWKYLCSLEEWSMLSGKLFAYPRIALIIVIIIKEEL